MILCGIVGWKNSGKTYIAQKLIKYFSKKNYYVASIKHAHHSFEIDQPHTDSYFHRKAGAREVIISSSNRWAKIKELNTENEKNLQELIKELESPDIVIIEGFKNSSHPKIEIIKDNYKDYLFPNLINVIGIVSNIKIQTQLPQFNFDEIEKIAELIVGKNDR